MKKFKKMLCLAGLALTGLALVACSGKTEETANKESSTELSDYYVALLYTGSSSRKHPKISR